MRRVFKIWAVREGPFSVEQLYDNNYKFDIPEEDKNQLV